MYAEELQAYNYHLPYSLDNVRMVGWIDSAHPFPTGQTGTEVSSKLSRIIGMRFEEFDVHVNVVRGVHPCNFCGRDIRIVDPKGNSTFLGMSELWLPFGSYWIAAPSLIVHYMEEHGYQPPQEFLEAVKLLDMCARIISQKIYDAALRQMASRNLNCRPEQASPSSGNAGFPPARE
jgi:hypothetical protein